MSGILDPAHYEAILSGLPNGVYVVDVDRKILFWNHGAEQITGYRSQEVLGRHCQDNLLMHCDENYTPLCGCRCPLRETISDGNPREANVYLRHKEGHRVPVKIRAVPIRDVDGAVIGAAESFDEWLKRVVSTAEVSWWGERLGVTVSIGGAAVHPGDTVESLLERSERALLGCAGKGGDGGDVH